jgi:hypothetical protein
MIKFNKDFKSEIDQFFEDFNKRYPERSLSQQEEIKKYSRINQLLCDSSVSQESTSKIQETFYF